MKRIYDNAVLRLTSYGQCCDLHFSASLSFARSTAVTLGHFRWYDSLRPIFARVGWPTPQDLTAKIGIAMLLLGRTDNVGDSGRCH